MVKHCYTSFYLQTNITGFMQVNLPTYVSIPWEYTKSTRLYQAFDIQANKIMDIVCPKNELTQRRSFKFIPNFVVNYLGHITYVLLCPSHKILQSQYLDSHRRALVREVEQVFTTLVKKVKEKCPSTRKMLWEVSIKEDNTVNAFCCPGGKVIITTGILAKLEGDKRKHIRREDLIAAVLSHEIVHAVAEHSRKSIQISLFLNLIVKFVTYLFDSWFVSKPTIDKTLQGEKKKEAEEEAAKKFKEDRDRFCKILENVCAIPTFFLKAAYSQSDEFEADKFGIEIANEAKIYNLDAFVTLQERFLEMKGQNKEPQKGWFRKVSNAMSSHPPSQERLQKNQETINRLKNLA